MPAGSRVYRIQPKGRDQLRSYLDGLWSDVLSAYGDEIKRRRKSRQKTNAGTFSRGAAVLWGLHDPVEMLARFEAELGED